VAFGSYVPLSLSFKIVGTTDTSAKEAIATTVTFVTIITTTTTTTT
jgi:hypothetical protein